MKSATLNDSSWLHKLTTLIEQDILGVKIGIYGIGLLGLGLAFKSTRPFKKICLPNDIPSSFIKEKVKLKGRVIGIEFFPKTLLAIDHEPLLGASFRRTARLPVNLEGIQITGNGVSWLQNIIVGKKVDFVVFEKQEGCLSCQVQDSHRDIADHLVSIGFASVAPFNSSLEVNETYKKYYKRLLQTENYAERKRNGMWWDRPQRFSILDFMLSKAPVLKLKTVLQRT